MNSYVLSKEAFLQQYILGRTSHKKDLDQLLAEAKKAYEEIHKSARYQ